MKEIVDEVERWRAQGEQVAVATVVATRQSAPRPVGAKFAVSETARCAARSRAAASRATSSSRRARCSRRASRSCSPTGSPTTRRRRRPPVRRRDRRLRRAARVSARRRAARARARATSAPSCSPWSRESEPGAKLLVLLDRGEALGDAPRRAGGGSRRELRRNGIVEARGAARLRRGLRAAADDSSSSAPSTRPRRSAPRRSRSAGTRSCIDARAQFATPERDPERGRLVVEWPEDALAEVGARPRHRDRRPHPRPQVRRARRCRPRSGPTRSTSARSSSRRRRRSAAPSSSRRAVTDEQLARIHGPAGLDIGADAPAETAISILTEALAVRAARDGRPLGPPDESTPRSAMARSLGRIRHTVVFTPSTAGSPEEPTSSPPRASPRSRGRGVRDPARDEPEERLPLRHLDGVRRPAEYARLQRASRPRPLRPGALASRGGGLPRDRLRSDG